MNCEAVISKFPDSTLGPDGFGVNTSCQRCEAFVVSLYRSSNERDLRSAKDMSNMFLQSCDKLLEKGFTKGQIPQELLPKL